MDEVSDLVARDEVTGVVQAAFSSQDVGGGLFGSPGAEVAQLVTELQLSSHPLGEALSV